MKKRATTADVLIIGAGPAGSVAGSLLAKQGHHVLCLEAGVFPRFQIGESLLPRCNDILEEAGLLEIVQKQNYMPKPAAFFLKENQTERFNFGEMFPGQRPAAMQVPRDHFDQTLATAAQQKGVEIHYQQRVDAVEFDSTKGIATISATDVATETRYDVTAKFVLDCSGYGRVLPKLLKLESEPKLAPRCAVFSHFENDMRPEGDRAGDIWVCIHPKGPWTWVIPFSNGRTSVGVVVEREMLESHGNSDHARLMNLLALDPNCDQRLKNAVPVLKTQRLEGWSASVKQFYGPGWALTGNASEFLDPVFSSGVTLALESASRAAKLCSQHLKGQPANWQTDYNDIMRKAVGVFGAFVTTWYTGELQTIMLYPKKEDRIKRAITSVLGGYVLDDRNPFVKDPHGTLSGVLKLIA